MSNICPNCGAINLSVDSEFCPMCNFNIKLYRSENDSVLKEVAEAKVASKEIIEVLYKETDRITINIKYFNFDYETVYMFSRGIGYNDHSGVILRENGKLFDKGNEKYTTFINQMSIPNAIYGNMCGVIGEFIYRYKMRINGEVPLLKCFDAEFKKIYSYEDLNTRYIFHNDNTIEIITGKTEEKYGVYIRDNNIIVSYVANKFDVRKYNIFFVIKGQECYELFSGDGGYIAYTEIDRVRTLKNKVKELFEIKEKNIARLKGEFDKEIYINLTEEEHDVLSKISKDEKFLAAMDKLKSENIIEYNLKLTQFRQSLSMEDNSSNENGISGLDVSGVPKCPTCGSTKVKKISGATRWVSVGMVGLSSSNIGKTMVCSKCGYKW